VTRSPTSVLIVDYRGIKPVPNFVKQCKKMKLLLTMMLIKAFDFDPDRRPFRLRLSSLDVSMANGAKSKRTMAQRWSRETLVGYCFPSIIFERASLHRTESDGVAG
jgi:hypothetical protein